MSLLTEYMKDFSHLFYPYKCVGCGTALDAHEVEICDACYEELPTTLNWNWPDNEVAQMFWGKIDIEQACAYLYFYKGGIVQGMLHALKYKGHKQVGIELGNMFGNALRDTSYQACDLIIPVPLHELKERKRGYNQCTHIANGMAEVMKKPVIDRNLVRWDAHESQTHKNRFERWQNVRSRFKVSAPDELVGKHILLIDDVITTGSTIEACAAALKTIHDVRISVATIACPSLF